MAASVPTVTKIDEHEWFSHAMNNIPEATWDYGTIPPEVLDAAGEFQQMTLHELRNMLPSQPRRIIAPFIMYRVRDDKHQHEDLFDTSALQFNSDPCKRSLFQVASNYNCLELGAAWRSPIHPTYLSGLMSDTTQGPSAAGGAGAGAILRSSIHRYGPMDSRPLVLPSPDQPTAWVPHDYCADDSSAGGYINLLSQVPELADAHTNGKLYNTDETANVLPPPEKMTEDWIYNVQIGLQTGVRAQYNRGHDAQRTGLVTYRSDGPRIDQVYTSTCIHTSGVQVPREDLTDAMLEAAYDGTYLAAAIQQSRRVVLTFIGGNEFSNPKTKIIQAIVNAHEKYAQYLHPECTVMLPIYNRTWGYLASLLEVNPSVFQRET